MHFIPSVARTAATKIAQTAKAGKAKIFLSSCAALCFLLLCVWGVSEAVYKVTAGGWEAGRRAWKAGDCEAALAAWSHPMAPPETPVMPWPAATRAAISAIARP